MIERLHTPYGQLLAPVSNTTAVSNGSNGVLETGCYKAWSSAFHTQTLYRK